MAQNKKQLRRRKEHREIFEMINTSDVTIQVLDARFPQKCRNKTIEDYARSKGKQLICCINKTDLIPHEFAEKWKNIISKEYPTIFMSAADRQGTSFLRKQIRRYVKSKEALACVVGYPNVGKSSLINVLRGKKSAPTSPTAGFTRHLRTVNITSTLKLIDTPGIAPTDILSIEDEVFLATVSAEDITNPDIICNYIFDQFRKEEMESEMEKYLGTTLDKTTEDILGFFATKRGLLGKGAEPQIEEAARIIIRDFQSSKITFYEKPPTKLDSKLAKQNRTTKKND